MKTIKLYLTRRVLLTLSVFFQYILPIIYLYAKSDSMTYDNSVKLRFWALLFMGIYLITILKVLKQKVNQMRTGALKRLINSSNILVVILIVYMIYSILERSFIGADVFFAYFSSFEIIGFFLYNLDSFINNKYITERAYQKVGYEKAKEEYYKEYYKSKFQQQVDMQPPTNPKPINAWYGE